VTSYRLSSTLSRNVASILIAADSGEPRMAQTSIRGPFEKLDSGNQKRIEPTAYIHFRSRQALSPVPFTGFGQVNKRASRDLQLFEMQQQDPAGAAASPARTRPA
jgi:hypothetical protein